MSYEMTTQELLTHHLFDKVEKCVGERRVYNTQLRIFEVKPCEAAPDYFCNQNDCYYCEDCAVEAANEWSQEDN